METSKPNRDILPPSWHGQELARRENATQIRNLSLSKGMRTLREDGWAKVFKGVTSVKEIIRVTEEQ